METSTNQKSHPEQRTNEVFIGNMTEWDAETSFYISMRLGAVAYDEHGRMIEHMPYDDTYDDNVYPAFINKRELERTWK